MKLLLAALLCLLTLSSAHAQVWPRNPTTGKVEFKGVLPWPASAKTEAQRRALVRRWYTEKLTALTRSQVEIEANLNKTNGLLTYAALPKTAILSYGKGEGQYLLSYFVNLSPVPRGLSYTINFFDFSNASAVELETERTPLEQVIPDASPSEQTALLALRKRLAVAVASW